MEEYKKYLADQILSEERIVTYRSLSRALKVHVNTAKGMLYEFHRSQNGMRPGTIHATYTVYGIQKVEKTQEDGDVEMTSSPPDVESLSDEVVTHSMTLVSGERLKEVLATYEDVSSFYIYSLARHPTRELQMLADVSQQMKEQSTDDSASMAETYGTITNPNVRKRDRQGKRSVPATATATPAAKSVKKEPAPSTTKPVVPESKVAEPIKQEPNEPTKAAPSSTAATKKGAAPPPSLKKSGSSGIMSSFAKAAAIASSKPKETPSKATTNSPANNSPALSDDGEDDDEDIPAAKSSANSGRKSRKDREAELKQMMEESEDEEDPEDKEEEPVDEPMEEAPEPEVEAKVEPEPAEIVSSTGDGRRRGKRRVMKKKQIMDDQGYLVTIQEPAWEEFSEDEAPPPPTKPKPSSAPSSGSQASKPKKAAPKGQGNIMSFFSKK
ncbi:hypothetical protein EsH8_VIII_000407 [Colletotrichum jinshuiense]